MLPASWAATRNGRVMMSLVACWSLWTSTRSTPSMSPPVVSVTPGNVTRSVCPAASCATTVEHVATCVLLRSVTVNRTSTLRRARRPELRITPIGSKRCCAVMMPPFAGVTIDNATASVSRALGIGATHGELAITRLKSDATRGWN